MDRNEAMRIAARFLAAAFPERSEDLVSGICGENGRAAR
jgi:hypothetical protein